MHDQLNQASVARGGDQPGGVAVDERAPIVLHAQVEIAADRGTVWDVLASIEAWPEWNRDIAFAALEGELEPGTSFRWKSGRSSLLSRLVTVRPPAEIAWTGHSMGIRVVHVYRLEDRGDVTLVQTDESATGVPARLFRGPIGRQMHAAVQNHIQRLKVEAERRVGAR